jgi:hypothetical protein
MKRAVNGWMIGIVGAVAVLSGCASKEDRALYARIQERSPELQTLQQSEKVVFHSGKENETIVIATYLPEKDGRYEEFALAVYPPEGLAGREAFALEGTAPVSVGKIARNELPESVRRTVPGWFTVYRARFAPTTRKRFTLTIRGADGEMKKVLFYKGPKYLVTKPKF